MNHPVKLSQGLVLDARLTGQAMRRSIAGQIEFWANLGRAIEPLIQGGVALALSLSGRATPLSACIASIESAEGRQRLDQHLTERPYPHYKPAPDGPGLLVRIDADGHEVVGKFVNRKFVPVGARLRG